MKPFAALFVFSFCVLLPSFGAAQSVTVFAAASLRGALDEVASDFDGIALLAFGGSGTMARQVAAGAPADIIILANSLWMDWLNQQDLPGTSSPSVVAQNRLVVIGPKPAAKLEDPARIPERLGTGRLAMGQRDAVPAGLYARQWLETVGLWRTVKDNLAETDNVRAALALVARRAAPLGIVYATDAQAEADVDVIYENPAKYHAPILYLAAALTPSGQRFLPHLTSASSAQIFLSFGFLAVVR